MKIGVLDIQGSVVEHVAALEKLGLDVVRVKHPEDLEGIKGLIIPGGESTTIGKLLRRFGLREAILKRVDEGMAIWGTCAGAILLAKKIVGSQQADGLELMNIAVERNAYGRQLDSFETPLEFALGAYGQALAGQVPAIFIRAPKIVAVGDDVEILATYKNEIVAAREGKLLATTFHPELSEDLQIHEYFVKMCDK